MRLCTTHSVEVWSFRCKAAGYALTSHPRLKPREVEFKSAANCRTIIRQGRSG